MPELMKLLAGTGLLGTVLAAALYRSSHIGIFLTLAITFGTIAYHLLMRLLVGGLLGDPALVRPDHTKGWFRVRPWEQRAYRVLGVKGWKGRLPTYSPELFSPKLHSWEEIAGNMCRSELVHEASAVLSFLPVAAYAWFGDFWAFFLTSLAGATLDLLFVVVQRYNRGRVLRLVGRKGGAPRSGGE